MEYIKNENNEDVILVESAILGSLLTDAESLKNYIDEIEPTDFSQEKYKVIFKHFKEYVKNKGIDYYDPVLFSHYLSKQGFEGEKELNYLLDNLYENYSVSYNFDVYYNVFRKNNLARELIKANDLINQKARDTINTDANVLIEKSIKNLIEIANKYNFSNDYKNAGEIAEKLFNNFVKFGAEDFTDGVVIPSGFNDLDYKIKGFRSGEFTIIAARPSCGKTAFAVSTMLNMLTNPIDKIYKDEKGEIKKEKKKTKIAFYSLEMGARAIIKRFLSSFACEDANYINGIKKIENDEIENNIKVAYKNLIEILKNQLFIFDRQMTITELKSSARQIKQQQDVDIIFIDYMTRILSNDKGQKEEWQKIGEISNALKSLANELDIPIVCLSQLNREAEEQKPKLSHLRNSGSIEQDADLIIFLHKEKTEEEKKSGKDAYKEVYYNDSFESHLCEKEKDILISIAKNRNGETGDFYLAFLSNFVKFVNTSSCQYKED